MRVLTVPTLVITGDQLDAGDVARRSEGGASANALVAAALDPCREKRKPSFLDNNSNKKCSMRAACF